MLQKKLLKNHNILKIYVVLLKQPLTYLINLFVGKVYYRRHSKLQEWLLSIWKKKILFPIFVPSLFCQFLANCKKIVCILAFTRFWQNTNFFKEQFGFRNNHSTSHALTSLMDVIKKYLDNDFLFVEFLSIFRKHSTQLTIKFSQLNLICMLTVDCLIVG